MLRRFKFELIITVVLAVAASTAFLRIASAGERFDAAAHDHAEHILYPAFIAKMNEWMFNHPMSDPAHLRKLDVADLKRYQAARQAWKEFDEEMKRAGY